MNLSMNEYEDAERYLDDRTVDKDFYNRLRVLANYYRDEGNNERSIREKLKEYVSYCGESPSLNVWSDMIDAAIKRSKKVKLIKIDSIPITQSEMDKIEALEGTQLKRLAFTLLCLSKYRDKIVDNNNHWVCYEDKDIMRLANMKPSLKRIGYLYRTLEEIGYLKFPQSNSSISMQVLFADDNLDDVVLNVTLMKNLGYQYLKYKGEPYFECESCGLTVKIKNKHVGRPPKYCDQCAALIHAKQMTDAVMRIRNGKYEPA